jgi:hypothetical protein
VPATWPPLLARLGSWTVANAAPLAIPEIDRTKARLLDRQTLVTVGATRVTAAR